jgi:hypothetical protein
MLWPTTIRIDSHWNRAEQRPASLTQPKSAVVLAWPGQRTSYQSSSAQSGETVHSAAARSSLSGTPATHPRGEGPLRVR